MKKIKNFKINLRQREILRLLKTTSRITEITAQLEEAVDNEAKKYAKLIMPAALYETLPKDKINNQLLTGIPENSVAATLFLITINPSIEQDVKDAQKRDENILSQLVHCIAMEALEQSENFIQRLLNEEVKQENCELTARREFDKTDQYVPLLSVLPGDKIGISINENSQSLHPLYTSCGIIPWIPAKKK